jgi:hypothetical protein
METIKNIIRDLDDHVYGIELDSGRTLAVWNGQPCYSLPDEAKGFIEVGSVLQGERMRKDGSYMITFAKA